jgi:hypothetical protein
VPYSVHCRIRRRENPDFSWPFLTLSSQRAQCVAVVICVRSVIGRGGRGSSGFGVGLVAHHPVRTLHSPCTHHQHSPLSPFTPSLPSSSSLILSYLLPTDPSSTRPLQGKASLPVISLILLASIASLRLCGSFFVRACVFARRSGPGQHQQSTFSHLDSTFIRQRRSKWTLSSEPFHTLLPTTFSSILQFLVSST